MAGGLRAQGGLFRIDARGRWAVRLPGGRLLAWSGGLTRSGRGYAFTIGGGFEPVSGQQPFRPARP